MYFKARETKTALKNLLLDFFFCPNLLRDGLDNIYSFFFLSKMVESSIFLVKVATRALIRSNEVPTEPGG